MALKATVPSLDEVPEPLREHYQQKGEIFVLGLEGIEEHPAAKHLKDREAKAKTDLAKAKKDLETATAALAAFGEITPEEIEALKADAEKGGKKPTKEELDQMVTDRFAAVKLRLEKERDTALATVKERDDELGKTKGTLQRVAVGSVIKDAAAKKNVRPNALQLVERMASETWRLDEEGNPVAMKGDQPISGAHGPITPDEWIESLQAEHDYLFEPNKGGGASGSETGVRGAGKTLDLSGPNAIGKNLEGIRDGKITAFRA